MKKALDSVTKMIQKVTKMHLIPMGSKISLKSSNFSSCFLSDMLGEELISVKLSSSKIVNVKLMNIVELLRTESSIM